MEGLEIQEIRLSKITTNDSSIRIDSEYFKKEFIDIENYFIKNNFSYLHELANISDGDHAKFPENQKQEVRYLQAKDIKNSFIEDKTPIFVSRDYFLKNKRSHISSENILLSIMGNVGDIALTPLNFEPCMANRAIAILKNIKNVDVYFLFSFLNSEIAKIQIEQQKNGGVQERLNLELLSKIKIPLLSNSFQKNIGGIVKKSNRLRKNFITFYFNAEKILLDDLDFSKLSFIKKNNVKFLKESFLTTGRLDAEYYQPKYDEYLNLLKNYHNGFKKLTDLCELKNDNYLPNDETQYRYIELSNIGNNGEVTGCTVNFGKELPSRARRIVKEGDVLISSIEGSLSSCALVTKEYDGVICSTGFYVVNSKKINSETLLILFKSELMQNLLKQGCSGTILTAINNDEFKNLLLPVIDDNTQQTIASLIQQSSKLKKQSEQLLEVAKKAVEIAIEQNEATAIDYINSYSELMQEDINLH
ncbi:restriction endonuclease subunit S [Gilliamella sp. B3804]|uniref:restriction endonuclease subunit S n=1 Tax=Gilliamella sp. B3804 TaxID=2817998 RepID=UPI00226A0433|nr:restriction endonuclease subunit S [Gilliamella sp. B3804]